MRHSFFYRGQHIAVEISVRDDRLSWRFAVNGGEYCCGERRLESALPGSTALAVACSAVRVVVDKNKVLQGISLDDKGGTC